MSDTPTISRRQLYEEIWSTPLGDLSKKYGLSSEGFARACARHRIPRPPRGYWPKKRAGWASPPPELPPMDDPHLETVTLTEEHVGDVAGIVEPVRHAVDDEVNRRIEEELAAPAIVVPDRLRSPHPFVANTIEEQVRRAAEERRRKADPRSSYQSPEVLPSVRANVTAHSKETRERAYRVMDTFFKALEERGYSVGGKPEKFGGTTIITVLGMKFDVKLHEPCRREIHLLTPEEQERKKKYGSVFTQANDLVPTGRLSLEFRAEGSSIVLAQRHDGERVRIESTLKDLIVTVLRKVDEERQAARERNRTLAVQREAEARQRVEQARQMQQAREQEQEASRVQGLLAEVKRWRDSQEIRMYLDEVRRVIAGRGQVIHPGSELDLWMKWAERAAHRLDPLKPSVAPQDGRPDGPPAK